jgi:hypothetical protein
VRGPGLAGLPPEVAHRSTSSAVVVALESGWLLTLESLTNLSHNLPLPTFT